MDKILAEIIADLFVNLAAGWFGAILIFPINQNRPKRIKLWLFDDKYIIWYCFLGGCLYFSSIMKANKKPTGLDFYDLNARAGVAFGLAVIALLLAFIAWRLTM